MSGSTVTCSSCGKPIDLNDYVLMMVLSRDQALFTLQCGECGETVSTVEAIPPNLYEEIETAAHEVHAGMGVQAKND